MVILYVYGINIKGNGQKAHVKRALKQLWGNEHTEYTESKQTRSITFTMYISQLARYMYVGQIQLIFTSRLTKSNLNNSNISLTKSNER